MKTVKPRTKHLQKMWEFSSTKLVKEHTKSCNGPQSNVILTSPPKVDTARAAPILPVKASKV